MPDRYLLQRLVPLAVVSAVAGTPITPRADAQSLRGSQSSIDRMYRHARSEGLSFYETPSGVRKAVKQGRLVRLEPDNSFELHAVGYPYVRPSTRLFVERLASQYEDVCGEPLIVTSAVRPATRQPANSAERSVHPTGMAVDLRKPRNTKCLRWLRSTLLDLENDDLLEATEEHAPAHFHVAVFPTAYTRYAAARAKAESGTRTQLASHTSSGATTYKVHEGDTLWDIAKTHDTTVDAILSANDLAGDVIQPGQELRIPSGN
jgi:LysM repeat protein